MRIWAWNKYAPLGTAAIEMWWGAIAVDGSVEHYLIQNIGPDWAAVFSNGVQIDTLVQRLTDRLGTSPKALRVLVRTDALNWVKQVSWQQGVGVSWEASDAG